jgi:hypothetical protein
MPVLNKNTSAVKLLLDYNADENWTDEYNRTVLQIAKEMNERGESGTDEIIDLLQ